MTPSPSGASGSANGPGPARGNPALDKLKAGDATLGFSVGLGSPTVAELVSCVGFDWISIETDHYGLDIADVQSLLMASARTGTVPLVRVPRGDLTAIQRSLDLGAMGVVVPMLSSAAEAREIVEATRYPPDGNRAFGPLRATRYYLEAADYLETVERDTIIWLILETRGLLEDLEEVAAIPGISGVIIGPCDLALSLGLSPLADNPEIEEIGERVLELGRRTGLAIGINVGSPEELLRRRDQGFRILDYGPDYQLLLGALLPALEAFGLADDSRAFLFRS